MITYVQAQITAATWEWESQSLMAIESGTAEAVNTYSLYPFPGDHAGAG